MSSALSQESTKGPSYFILTLLSIDERGAQLTTLAGEEVAVVFDMDPTLAVVKDLGRWARRNLGLRGRTEPGEFTQIVWQNQVHFVLQTKEFIIAVGVTVGNVFD